MGKLSLSTGKTYLLWACILLCLLPFVILSFFNFMALDDYSLSAFFREHDFFEAQKIVYLQWEGRFTAYFIWGVFARVGIVEHYYFSVFLLFAFFTWMALLLLLYCINTYCLGRTFSLFGLAPASLVLLVLDLYMMAEISSGMYWFSAVVVYQTAFILFLVLAACMVRRFARGAGRLRGYDVLIVLLAVLICGCNEIAAIALAGSLLLVLAGHVYYRLRIPPVLLVYLGVVVLTGIVIVCTSGVLSARSPLMKGHMGYAGVAVVLLGRGLSVFYYMFKEPLFWVCAAVSYFLGMRMSAVLESYLRVMRSRRFFIPGLVGIILLVFCTLAPVLVVTHGSIPERAINNLTSLSGFYLLGWVFLAGACGVGPFGFGLAGGDQAGPAQVRPGQGELGIGGGRGQVGGNEGGGFGGASGMGVAGGIGVSRLLIVLLCCTLLASYNYKEAWKNVITGYFYHTIQVDRQKVLLSAGEHHQRSAAVTPYAVALEEKIRQRFPRGIPVTVRQWLLDQPTLLYHDHVEESPLRYLSGYYRLDSVVVKQF